MDLKIGLFIPICKIKYKKRQTFSSVPEMDRLSANDLFVFVESLHLLLVTLHPRGCENANACTSESACLDRSVSHTLTVDGTAKCNFSQIGRCKRDNQNSDVERMLKRLLFA